MPIDHADGLCPIGGHRHPICISCDAQESESRQMPISTPIQSSNLAPSIACPGLFCPTHSQDGLLVRLRIPGGRLKAAQAIAVADFAESDGDGDGLVLVTNRANLQLRSRLESLSSEQLEHFQNLGLAAPIAAVDHLRNVMVSPTAGLDESAVLDVWPIVEALDQYISSHAELAGLSAKFSVGIDAGENVSIRHRKNDIWLMAESATTLRVFFDQTIDAGIVIGVADVVDLVQAIAQVYLDYAPQLPQSGSVHRRSSKPRLRDLIDYFGVEWWGDRIREFAPHITVGTQRLRPSRSLTPHQHAHIGIHPHLVRAGLTNQSIYLKQFTTQTRPHNIDHPPTIDPRCAIDDFPQVVWAGLGEGSGVLSEAIGKTRPYRYIGIIVPLGYLTHTQLRGLAQIAQTYGNDELRLTPWQNMIIPYINTDDIPIVQTQLTKLNLSCDPTNPAAAIVTCAGKSSCKAGETYAQQDAQQLLQKLSNLTFNTPINIHVSGCAKGCAQPYASDIALMGVADNAYEIYLREGLQPFGRRLYPGVTAEVAIDIVTKIIHIYQNHIRSETFSQFVERFELAELRAEVDYA
jgi:ferredoxin-nitrite reductase